MPIVSPITPHADRLDSHRSGWARMWSKCLNEPLSFKSSDWLEHPVVYFEHGMEWKDNAKSLNFFLESKDSVLQGKDKGWVTLAERAKRIENYEGQIVSLDRPCPMLGTLLKSRLKDWSPECFKSIDFWVIDNKCAKATTIAQRHSGKSSLVLGDSHSLSAWDPESAICRLDGQTLHAAIKRGFDTWIEDYNSFAKLERLRTYFGNIDIRHHICRMFEGQEQKRAAAALCLAYIKELKRMQDKYGVDIEVVSLLPIENISRKLPKTGYYKGQPYWGSWQERTDVVNIFNDLLEQYCKILGFSFIKWHKLTNLVGELDFECMEKPRSVHLSPRFYLWDAA